MNTRRTGVGARWAALATCAPTLTVLMITLMLAAGCGESTADVAATPETHSDSGVQDAGADAADTLDADSTPDSAPSLYIDRGPQPTSDGPWEWLTHAQDGVAGAPHNYNVTPANFYEYVRFEIWESFRVRSIRVQVDVPASGELVVHVWDDFGGDRLALDSSAPLRSVSRAVSSADSGTWLELPLDPPLEVTPGRIVYAGVVVSGQSPRLLTDGEQEVPEGAIGSSLVWLSESIDPQTGTPTVYQLAAGDFLLQLEPQRVGVVAEADTLFEPWPELPVVSRGAFDDYDGDGDDDLMANGGRLFRNDNGVLVDVSGEALPEGVSFNGGVWGDFDDDGDPDWFGTGGADVLLRNDGGVFVDVTAASGIDDTQVMVCDGESSERHAPTEAAAWMDIDSDGLLDLYQANYECGGGAVGQDFLWHNQGDGTFVDITAAAGLLSGAGVSQASRGVAPADYDGDGDIDFLVTNYRLDRNYHWRNNGDGTFTDVAPQNGLVGEATASSQGWSWGHSIGATWADFDLDGALDVFVANLAHPRFFHFSDKQRLYLSIGLARDPGVGETAPYFLDVTDDAGIRYQETPSNPTAWDFDNDGDVDLIWTCVYDGRPSQFYRNDYPMGTWTEVTQASGLRVNNGWGSAVADLDLDGDLDYVSRSSWRNRNRFGKRSLRIRPRGSGLGATNRSGYGARVTVSAANRTRTHELTGAHGTGVADSPWLHFGLGGASAGNVEVFFPVSGARLTFDNLPAGRYTVHEDGTLESHQVDN